jgi:hypothetical protein
MFSCIIIYMNTLKLESLESEYRNKLTEYKAANVTYINKLQNPDAATYVIVGCGKDGNLYSKTALDAIWVLISDDSVSNIQSICLSNNGKKIYGVNKQGWVLSKLNYQSNWTTVTENSCCVTCVAVGQDGSMLGLGLDNQIWTKTDENAVWIHSDSGDDMVFKWISIAPNGSVYTIDFNNNVFKKGNYYNLSEQTWEQIGSSDSTSITFTPDESTCISVGTDGQMYTNSDYHTNYTDGWSSSAQNSCCVVSVVYVKSTAYTEISGKTYWGTTGITEGSKNDIKDCVAMCSTDPTCKGATFNSEKKYCWTRSGDSSISDGLNTDSAIILTTSKDILNLESLNQQLIDLNTQIMELYKGVPSEKDNINSLSVNGESLSENYNVLLKERSELKKLLEDYKTVDQEYNNQSIVVDQSNITFYFWATIAVIVIGIVIKLFVFPEVETNAKSFVIWTSVLIFGVIATLQLKNSIIYSFWVILIVIVLIIKLKIFSFLE